MEVDMEVDVLEVVEIDFDYEFEASRFFDFTREETEEEASHAEFWFQSAKTYPASPFVAKLFSMEGILAGSVNVSPKSKCADDEELCQPDESITDFEGTVQTILTTMQNGNLMDDQSVPHGCTSVTSLTWTQMSTSYEDMLGQYQSSCRGLTFYDHFSNDTKNLKTKPAVKPYMPRNSTFMKPTASQLAKQNPRNQFKHGVSRFQKLLPNASSAHCGVEIQASKRQKLEGGQLRKVGNMKLQSNLVHKAPNKVGNVPGILQNRLKITIPVEPDLLTTNRTQRSRPFTFKARPLNRKILEAPTLSFSKKSTPQMPLFEVFHLKTMERAQQNTLERVQQNTPVITSSLHYPIKVRGETAADPFMGSVNKVGSRLKAVNSVNEDTSKSGHSFKARPLDKKIFSSKGDLGVFRNTKRAVTVPKEFDFQTEKRIQNKPLSELFAKLSVAPESELKISAPSKLPCPSYIHSKGPKENRGHVFHQGHSMKDLQKDKPHRVFGGENNKRNHGFFDLWH